MAKTRETTMEYKLNSMGLKLATGRANIPVQNKIAHVVCSPPSRWIFRDITVNTAQRKVAVKTRRFPFMEENLRFAKSSLVMMIKVPVIENITAIVVLRFAFSPIKMEIRATRGRIVTVIIAASVAEVYFCPKNSKRNAEELKNPRRINTLLVKFLLIMGIMKRAEKTNLRKKRSNGEILETAAFTIGKETPQRNAATTRKKIARFLLKPY